jgi:hypothetical protein
MHRWFALGRDVDLVFAHLSRLRMCVLLGGLAFAACGSDSADHLSKSQWVDRANQLCSAAYAEIEAGTAEPLPRGEELVDDLAELGSTDADVQAAVDAFRAALRSSETRADLDAMDAIGLQFDAVGADDCGLGFKSGL